ncbi:hypothetical protein [Duganella radicis]|uniref:Uncharacterized protein n=1 Tax=Duganella radicis TaxID=551988 RepID=A0A6L6PLR3_9BURK|nr:hypothetical protein [Duganella radicis]MTV39581.1 hypothetical protein [Duganella radicis]
MEFEKKEKSQSHAFVFFDAGPPYCQLGWSRYREFNDLILAALGDSEQAGVTVYLHEHEFPHIEGCFVWCFSFFQADPGIRETLSKRLQARIESIMSQFAELRDSMVLRNHSDEFDMTPDFARYYVSLVDLADKELLPVYPSRAKKSYDKPDLDLDVFKKEITVEEFKAQIGEHLSHSSIAHIKYLLAPDGFFSTVHRPNKYLREELIPAFYFMLRRRIPDAATMKFGLEKGEIDVKIKLPNEVSMSLEITSALPEGDHLLFSIVNQGWQGDLPVKTRHELKKANDSLAGKVVAAIAKKQEKTYPANATLLVVIPPEYLYQGEEYILNEMLNEVRSRLSEGKRSFCEVVALCNGKIYTVF